ncbi:MAG: pilus assembly protein PilM, partial [Nitrospirota bacterium]|nr:pilus assembly protein PilM [Nitrospirota bacterium]
MNKMLGVYFGPKIITLVETKGKKISNTVQIKRSLISPGELEEKIPDEVKIVALFKDELRKNNIDAKEAVICLSGKDLIIRTFEIPVMPANELVNIINFEVKKYIPFKVEDLIADFQTKLDKVSRRNQILYVGIKKEVLYKYLSVMAELNIKVISIEYSAFSFLRFLKLTKFNNNGIVGIINMDLAEEDEINFIILDNGFPLFSRDITLTAGGSEELPKAQEAASGLVLEKIKNEIRISLDYYHRKFPAKKIGRTYFVANAEHRSDLEGFLKEISLPAQFIETAKAIEIRKPFSLGIIKSYGSSLLKIIKTDFRINILVPKAKPAIKVQKEGAAEFGLSALLSGLKVDSRFIALGLFICLLVFGLGFFRKFPLQRELNQILLDRPKALKDKGNVPLSELVTLDSEMEKQASVLNKLISKQPYFTEALAALPRNIPNDMRLTNLQ